MKWGGEGIKLTHPSLEKTTLKKLGIIRVNNKDLTKLGNIWKMSKLHKIIA